MDKKQSLKKKVLHNTQKPKTKKQVYVLFLVKQTTGNRSEHLLDLFSTAHKALDYCRRTSFKMQCRQNITYCSHYTINKRTKIELAVNYDNANFKLLVKGIDFDRREIGRTNNNPRWYLHITTLPIN